MLSKLNLLPLLVIPVLTTTFVLRERIVELPWARDPRTEETLPPMERFELRSKHTGASYRIYVQTPHSYAESETRYPVFYALNARPTDGVYNDMVLPLLRKNKIPEAIIVCVTMPTRGGGAVQLLASRGRRSAPVHTWADDLTFHVDPEDPTEGGGGEAFLAFLEEELLKEIDSRYRTDPRDRGIGGMDLGGLFAVSVSYRKPGLFKRAIAIAPRVRFADFAIVDELRRMDPPRRRRNGTTRLYIGIGEGEYDGNITEFEILRDVLERIDTDAVILKTEMLRGRTRVTQIVPAAQSGLKFVYDE